MSKPNKNECKESPDGYHYWVKQDGVTVCTRCGAGKKKNKTQTVAP